MTDRTALTRTAKLIAKDMAAGRMGPKSKLAMQDLSAAPEDVIGIVELLIAEGAKNKPSDDLIAALAFMLGYGLENVRYGVERADKGLIALAARLRELLIARGETGRISPPILLLVLHQFGSAKLEVGDELRELMQQLMEDDEEAFAATARGEGADYFARMAAELDHDPFAIHGCLSETGAAMPEDLLAGMLMATFGDGLPALREAAVGFLVSGPGPAGAKAAELIELAAPHKLVSPTMLRRMIAMRNWLPAADQPALDKALEACRKAAVVCAPAPYVSVRDVMVSGIDGSGACTVLVVAESGGEQQVCGILLKQDIGVRDAWVKHGLTPAEVGEMLGHVGGEVGLARSTMAYVALAVRHFLATNIASGVRPPFGLLDVCETVGLSDIAPEVLPVDTLVATLCDAILPAQLTPAAVTATLRESADWLHDPIMLASWFEHGVTAGLGGKAAPRARQLAVLLAGPLQARRRRWAEVVAWTALSLKHQPDADGWHAYAIVARELLGARPLDEIGIMQVIAEMTLDVADAERLRGARHAA